MMEVRPESRRSDPAPSAGLIKSCAIAGAVHLNDRSTPHPAGAEEQYLVTRARYRVKTYVVNCLYVIRYNYTYTEQRIIKTVFCLCMITAFI